MNKTWLHETLSEETGKTSIKRVMLIFWFFYCLSLPLFGINLAMIHLYFFALLLSSKTIESLGHIAQKK
jgi:hypothetical protein